MDQITIDDYTFDVEFNGNKASITGKYFTKPAKLEYFPSETSPMFTPSWECFYSIMANAPVAFLDAKDKVFNKIVEILRKQKI